jgi:membrane associated rhomboid family serine protease
VGPDRGGAGPRQSRSCTVARMDDPGRPAKPGPPATGRLTREEALDLLGAADRLLGAGEFAKAGSYYQRVVGFDDSAVTAAALLGLGEARYRMDDEAGAVETWKTILELGETPSTYAVWRNLAAAYVRAGENGPAMRAYREADARAPAADKAEIANRLGWLAKESGDPGTARKYFARARGDGPLIPFTYIIIAATTIVSMTVMLTAEGPDLLKVLWLDKAGVAAGEYWRLWTVTLVHSVADPIPIHLFFNMYALYLAGPIVERWYGSWTFLAYYLTTAAAASVASFVFGGDVPSVGASGAVFGLFGVLLAADLLHHPVDRASRGLVSQLGFLVLINFAFGLASGGQIDNAAHVGGFLAGLWLGAVLPPTRVPTMSSLWQDPGGGADRAPTSALGAITGLGARSRDGRPPAYAPLVAYGAVAAVVVVGLLVGTDAREGLVAVVNAIGPAMTSVAGAVASGSATLLVA